MIRSHRILQSALITVLALVLLSCGSEHSSDEYYVFVSTNINIPYWKSAASGFSNSAAQFKGVRSEFVGPQTFDPKAERDALDEAVQKKATGILISVADESLLNEKH